MAAVTTYPLDLFDPTVRDLGEGPRWDARNQRALWVDITAGALITAVVHGPDAGAPTTLATVGDAVGFVAVAAEGLIAGVDLDLVALDDDGTRTGRVVASGHVERFAPTESCRCNDGVVDPAGRIVFGVMGESGQADQGAFYRVAAGDVHVVRAPATVPNGIGWSPDGTIAYVTDSGDATIFAYDFDVESGRFGTPRPFVTTTDGVPDGLCVDAQGCVWSAIWGGSEVRRFAPDGSLIGTIATPARQPTACAFVGAQRDRLLITSAAFALRDPAGLDGATFIADPGVTGLPVALADLDAP